jgi:Rps23 Pro-64 3,4-dihydroxylase Tpa1-like proline 4-hydroxylase
MTAQVASLLDNDVRLPAPSQIFADIDRDGFVIYKNAVAETVIDELRAFWLDYFAKNKADRKFVRGKIYLGERNFNSYSDINAWCMYRHFDFLWNASDHPRTRALHLQLHRHRNLAQKFDQLDGLTYSDNNYGIYISTSYYPPGKGFLKAHVDAHQDTPLLHYMLPLTFKGKDYQTGGLVCEDKGGTMVDVDAQMAPGDIVFFDGRQKHGVEKVESDREIGRLAIFAIPTFFLRDASLGVAKRSVLISIHELVDVLGLKSLLHGLKKAP